MENELNIIPRLFTIDNIINLLQRDGLLLKSNFPHHNRWDEQQKLRFIESLMLGVPIPAFYLLQNERGQFTVIDGLQRFHTIEEFLNNEFSLKTSVYLDKSFNDLYAKDISAYYLRKILTTTLNINIVENISSYSEYELFLRINNRRRPRKDYQNSVLKSNNLKLSI